VSQIYTFPQHSAQSPELLSYSPSPPMLLDTLGSIADDIPDFLRPRYQSLLHHFFTVTSQSISTNRAAFSVWPVAIPKLVQSHPYVLEGIFAMTALHLSRSLAIEKDRKTNFNIAAGKMNNGLSRFTKELQHVTEDNAEALFVFSVVTTCWTLTTLGVESKVSVQSIKDGNYTSNSIQGTISQLVLMASRIFRCLRGVLIILGPCWRCVAGGILSPVVDRPWWPNPTLASTGALEEDHKLKALEELWMYPGQKYDYYIDTLRSSLKLLRESFALVSQLTVVSGAGEAQTVTDWTSTMVWPTQASFEFIALIEQKNTEAWVILAHYAILPARVEGVWWMEGFPSNLVATAALVLGENRWKYLQWPAREVGLDLESLRLKARL
jgi:hypothetical protein